MLDQDLPSSNLMLTPAQAIIWVITREESRIGRHLTPVEFDMLRGMRGKATPGWTPLHQAIREMIDALRDGRLTATALRLDPANGKRAERSPIPSESWQDLTFGETSKGFVILQHDTETGEIGPVEPRWTSLLLSARQLLAIWQPRSRRQAEPAEIEVAPDAPAAPIPGESSEPVVSDRESCSAAETPAMTKAQPRRPKPTEASVIEWQRARVAGWPGHKPAPSEREDWEAVSIHFGDGLPRSAYRPIRERETPPEWRKQGRRRPWGNVRNAAAVLGANSANLPRQN